MEAALQKAMGGIAQAAGMTGAGVYNGGGSLTPGDYPGQNGGGKRHKSVKRSRRRSQRGGMLITPPSSGGGRSRRLKRVSGKARHRRTKSITVGGKRRGHRHTRKCKCSRKRKY